jgi:urease accessory protein
MADAQTLGLALSPADLVKLQAWFSPSFPVGAFSYSHGLEWAVQAGDVRSAQSLCGWIEGLLRHGSARSDAIVLCAIWRAVSSQDWSKAREIGALAAALQPTAERHAESLGQGSAFLVAMTAAWPHPAIQCFRELCPGEAALPVAAGAAAAAHGLPLDAVLIAYLHAFAANLVSAGVRLVPLGQTDGLKVTVALEPAILDVAGEAHAARFEDFGSAGVLADIASMRHETQYTRLFRS